MNRLQSSQFIEEAMDAHKHMVFHIAARMLDNSEAARDVVQEVSIKLFQSDIDFENDDHLRSWLITVTQNACTDILRREHRISIDLVDFTTPDVVERLMIDRTQLSESAIPINENEFLWRHVAMLPMGERMAVHLRFGEDFTVAEIAEILNKSPQYIRAQLGRAQRKLKTFIKCEQMRDQRKEEAYDEMVRKSTAPPTKPVRDLPKTNSVAEARRRNVGQDHGHDTGHGGGRTSEEKRRDRGRHDDGSHDGAGGEESDGDRAALNKIDACIGNDSPSSVSDDECAKVA